MSRLPKIVATIGPASWNTPERPEQVRRFLEAGVDMVRLNFSHIDHKKATELVEDINDVRASILQENNRHIALLADLQGPKFRTGKLHKGKSFKLKIGETVHLIRGDKGHIGGDFREDNEETDNNYNGKVLTTGTAHADLVVCNLELNQIVLMGDGTLRLRMIERVTEDHVKLLVLQGGWTWEQQGINVPSLVLKKHPDQKTGDEKDNKLKSDDVSTRTPTMKVPALTEKDRRDAVCALELGVDYLALSFVQSATDIKELRQLVNDWHISSSSSSPSSLFSSSSSSSNLSSDTKQSLNNARVLPRIIAKIEKPAAIQNIDEIIEQADGIMVARGDLGVECGIEKVPLYQRMMIRKANAAQKLVITATQMLYSMKQYPTPTRAEASDIALAVFQGTDALMLSEESAMGKHPFKAIKVMAQIAKAAQGGDMQAHDDLASSTNLSLNNALASAAISLANASRSSAIISICLDYDTVRSLSKLKPSCPVIAVTINPQDARLATVCYGITALLLSDPQVDPSSSSFWDSATLFKEIYRELSNYEWLNQEENIVFYCPPLTPWIDLNSTIKVQRLQDLKELFKQRKETETQP